MDGNHQRVVTHEHLDFASQETSEPCDGVLDALSRRAEVEQDPYLTAGRGSPRLRLLYRILMWRGWLSHGAQI
jgi:hypothetical protein